MTIQYMAPGFEPTTFGTMSPPITTRPGLLKYHHNNEKNGSAVKQFAVPKLASFCSFWTCPPDLNGRLKIFVVLFSTRRKEGRVGEKAFLCTVKMPKFAVIRSSIKRMPNNPILPLQHICLVNSSFPEGFEPKAFRSRGNLTNLCAVIKPHVSNGHRVRLLPMLCTRPYNKNK